MPRKLWKRCARHDPPADEKKGKMCRVCGLSRTAHMDTGLPLDWPAKFEAARKYAGMSLMEWDAADDDTRARAVALMDKENYRQAFDREAQASAESGVLLPASQDWAISAWSQRR